VETPVRRTPPETVTPTPWPRWPIYAAVAGVGLAAAATLWVKWPAAEAGGTTGTVVEADAATDASVTAPVTSVTAPVTTTTTSTSAVVPVDAGAVDAGKVNRPPADPCAGKKQGDVVFRPDGKTRIVCGLPH